MAIPIIENWQEYFSNPHEGIGSSYERIVINNKLMEVVNKYQITSVLETPSFGFTGTSGINSLQLLQSGCSLWIEDDDPHRIDLIRSIYDSLKLYPSIIYNDGYKVLDYADKSFDLLWNFSALWFVTDLQRFLSEAVRVSSKAILICVPNQSGMGYKSQVKTKSSIWTQQFPYWHMDDESTGSKKTINIANINPLRIKRIMKSLNCELVEEDFIDSPPWPDIGMGKEEFVSRHCRFYRAKARKQTSKASKKANALTILNYYKGLDSGFDKRMMRFYPFEKNLPKCLKKYWAHHYYMLFIPPC